MQTHSIRTAAQLLNQRHWVETSEGQILNWLVTHRIARNTLWGYELINATSHPGLLINHYSQRNTNTETGQQITRHTSAVRVSNDGIAWLAERMVMEVAA